MKNRINTNLQSGFTLLEILLTAAVLLVGLTAVFQTTRSALQTMTQARELTEAQNACQAVLNELLARSAPIEPHAGKTIEHLPHWNIRIDIYPAPLTGLYILHISAHQFSLEGTRSETRYQLYRWIPYERVKVPAPTEMFIGNEFEDFFQPFTF